MTRKMILLPLRFRPFIAVGLLLSMVASSGCESDILGVFREEEDTPTARPEGTVESLAAFAPSNGSVATEGTVGTVTYVEGTRLMAVTGFGLVYGLRGNGSANCPPSVREYLIKEIRRFRSANPHMKRHQTAEELLDSLDTAVVEVFGEVPAGAARGRIFDVRVRAMDPSARSLAGGVLLPCELKIFKEVSPTEIIAGRVHARAQGPVFQNPFTRPGGTAAADAREGIIIGGAVNVEDRRLTLVTMMESYSTVRQVEDVVNRRFPATPKTADGTSPTNVSLNLPKEYEGRVGRFLELVLHLPLSPSPVVNEARTKALITELGKPDGPFNDIGLSLEGAGPSVIPAIQPLYADPQRHVSYHAARTGLRLGDDLAVEVMVRHANDMKSPFRLDAIRELGDSGSSMTAVAALQELVDQGDANTRILAYEALRRADRTVMTTLYVGAKSQNFILDVLPTSGPPMIYVRRSTVRRIALIGGDKMRLRPPLLYAEPGSLVTLTAQAGEDKVTVLKKSETGETVLGPIKASLLVPLLVRFLGEDYRTTRDGVAGVEVDYGQVLAMLYRLCDKGAIQADMKWEDASIEQLIGPLEPADRPESEL